MKLSVIGYLVRIAAYSQMPTIDSFGLKFDVHLLNATDFGVGF